jgi:hypothetical protein
VRDDSEGKERPVSTTATITVLPSSEHPEYLTIHDAMMQIADAFALLKGDTGSEFEWRLISATTNSPMTAVGELIWASPTPSGVLSGAALALQESYQALSDVLAGDAPSGELDLPTLKRVLSRNLNGVGQTTITLADVAKPLTINPASATAALAVVAAPVLPSAPKRVRGTLEGELIDAGHYRKQPALKLRERSRGRIFWCRIPANLEDTFAAATSLDDVWKNARVRLRGWIEYNAHGAIYGMSAEGIQHVRVREIEPSTLHDPDFTEGMSAKTYLDRLRDGDLG